MDTRTEREAVADVVRLRPGDVLVLKLDRRARVTSGSVALQVSTPGSQFERVWLQCNLPQGDEPAAGETGVKFAVFDEGIVLEVRRAKR